MGDYKKSRGFGEKRRGGFEGNSGRSNFGQRSRGFGERRNDFGRGGGRDSGPREMYRSVCSACHKSCEVPFRPTGEKPVYCSDCFGSKSQDRGQRNDRNYGGNDRGRRDDRGSGNRERRDTRGRESFFSKEISPTHSFAPKIENENMVSIKKQLDSLHAKMDMLLSFLSPKANTIESQEKEEIKKVSLGDMISKTTRVNGMKNSQKKDKEVKE
jgi:CxxC-x17-CxxC domain-containing protein